MRPKNSIVGSAFNPRLFLNRNRSDNLMTNLLRLDMNFQME